MTPSLAALIEPEPESEIARWYREFIRDLNRAPEFEPIRKPTAIIAHVHPSKVNLASVVTSTLRAHAAKETI